jgi:hypothetical protein
VKSPIVRSGSGGGSKGPSTPTPFKVCQFSFLWANDCGQYSTKFDHTTSCGRTWTSNATSSAACRRCIEWFSHTTLTITLCLYILVSTVPYTLPPLLLQWAAIDAVYKAFQFSEELYSPADEF